MVENNNLKCIYFIYSLEINKKGEITSEHPLLLISIKNKTDEYNINYNIYLHRITIDKEKLKQNETSIKIQLIIKDINKDIYNCFIDISDKNQNIFLYDIEFRINYFLSFFSSNILPQSNLNISEKFEIFRAICIKNIGNNEKINEKKMEDLIYFTQEKLNNEKQYNFSFFLFLFNDINIKNIKAIERQIQLFNLNKIIFDEKKLYCHLDIRKITFLMMNFMDKKLDEERLNHDLLCILTLLYKYDQNLIGKIFFNKNLNNFLYKIILEDKRKPNEEELFPKLKLLNNILTDFIKFANNYKDILQIISYNDDCLESLELINNNFEFIISKIKEENEKIEKIKFDGFIEPKKKDNLIKIKNQIRTLLNFEKKFSINLVEISPKLLANYFILNENNINELVCLFQIIKMIALNKGVLKYVILSKLVFNKLNNYVKEKKLININLLLFIEIIPYKERNFDIAILNNIDIETINAEFIKKFKEINLEKLLKVKRYDLVYKICELTKNIKNFGKIFLLFDFNKDIDKIQMNLIKDRFIDLLETYDEKDCNNIIDYCSKLIYFLNINDCNLKSFFKDYFYDIFYNIADQVFCNIFSKYEYISLNDELKKIIYDFYIIRNNNDKGKIKYLLYEIENNDNFNNDDLVNYYIYYEDFFDLKESYKFSFLEKIINKNLLNKKCLLEYKKNNKTQSKEIITKIKNGLVKYKQIKKFFNNSNSKEELIKRIQIIAKFLDIFEKYKNLFHEIEQKVENINKIKKDLNITRQKMIKYFKKPKKEDINEIQELITEIESQNLNYYLMIQDQIKKFLEQKDIQLLPLNFEKSNFFFKIIYDETKKLFEDEIEIINETKKRHKNLVQILNSNSFNNENMNIVGKIMNELNEEQYKNLDEDIENLMGLNKEESVSKEKKEKTLSSLKIIWKKDLIYNFSIIFKEILSKMENKKTEFTSINNIICKYLEAPKNINIIKVCLEF